MNIINFVCNSQSIKYIKEVLPRVWLTLNKPPRYLSNRNKIPHIYN